MKWVKYVYIGAIVFAGLTVYLLWENKRLLGAIEPAILGLPFLIDLLSRERRKPGILRVEEFGWKWRNLVLGGALMTFLSLQLVGGVAGLIVSSVIEANPVVRLLGTTEIEVLETVVPIVLLTWGLPMFYLSGRWIGRRARRAAAVRRGVLAVVGTSILAVLVSLVMTLALSSVLENALLQDITSGLATEDLLLEALTTSALVASAMLLGYWRGRRQVSGTYLGYLLAKVRPEARQAIVTLAHDEALHGAGGAPDSE